MHRTVEYLTTSFALILRTIHSYVGILQHRFGGCFRRCQRNANGRSLEDLESIQQERLFECGLNPVGYPNGIARIVNVLHENRKFISAHSGYRGIPTHACLQPAGYLFNQSIAGGVPVAIIDDLEIININKKNGSRLVRMLFDVVHDALQSPQEQNAVWKTSEHVMAGVEKKFFLSVFSLGMSRAL